MKISEEAVATRKRILGKVGTLREPLFIAIGGVHGNEPAGVEAIERVIKKIKEDQIPLHGRFMGLVGNTEALELHRRYIQIDLNRIWKENEEEAEAAGGEYFEKRELYEILKSEVNGLREVYLLDLHTTSARSSPFFILGDTVRNRKLARGVPVPKVLGIEEQIEGTLSTYMNERGLVAINFEAGSHTDPASVDRHEAVLWLALAETGIIHREDLPFYHKMRLLLKEASRGLPRVFESVYRYGIREGEKFIMQPGYYNFKPVKKGEVLAYSNGEPVLSPMNGRIFMPLYQEQGDDGFFIIHKISRFWLSVSYLLRLTRPEKWVVFLPGINSCRKDSYAVRVNKKIAKWYPLKILHLLGYRKVRDEGAYLIVSRRRFDLHAPERIEL